MLSVESTSMKWFLTPLLKSKYRRSTCCQAEMVWFEAYYTDLYFIIVRENCVFEHFGIIYCIVLAHIHDAQSWEAESIKNNII